MTPIVALRLGVPAERRVAATSCFLPGGAWRLYGEAEGITHVFINGEHAVADGAFTDARPGTLLRAGRDTDPVTAT